MRLPEIRSSLSWLACVILLATALSHCGGEPSRQINRPAPDVTLISFGDRTVSVRDFMLEYQETKSFDEYLAHVVLHDEKAANPSGGDLPSAEINSTTDYIKDIAHEIAFESILAVKAQEQELDQKPEFTEYMKNTLDDELYQKVVVEEVLKNISITEADLRRFYEQNHEGLFMEDNTNVFQVRGIYVYKNAEGRPPEAAQQKINEAYKAIESGDSFEEAAVKYSEAPANIRGLANPIPPGSAAPAIEEQLKRLKKGEYSPIFEYNDRYYILKLDDFIEPQYRPYEEVRDGILKKLFDEKRNEGIYRLSRSLQEKHNCLINDEPLIAPENADPSSIVLSVPGVYELTFGEFKDMAIQNHKWTTEMKRDFLNVLANKYACLAEARARGWDESDVAATLSVWRRSRLADLYLSEQASDAVMPDEKIREQYEKYKDSQYLTTPAIYDLYHIFFRVPFDYSLSSFERVIRTRQAEDRANRARAELEEGRPFLDAAALYASNGDDASSGGRLGVIPENRMNAALQAAVVGLKAGEITKPIPYNDDQQMRFGYEIYYVRDITPPRPYTFDEARELIGTAFASKEIQELRQRLLDEFDQLHPAEFNQQALTQVRGYMARLAKRPDLQADIHYYAQTEKTANSKTPQ